MHFQVYVQHKIEEHAEVVWKVLQLLNSKAFSRFYLQLSVLGRILVAGSAGQMPKDVLECLRIIAQENGVSEPESFLETLERTGRLQFETWS